MSTDTLVTLTSEEIAAAIPHRGNWLLVRSISYHNLSDMRITGIVSFSRELLRGHFPDQTIVAGVLLTEAACQVAAVFIGHQRLMCDQNPPCILLRKHAGEAREIILPNQEIEVRLTFTRLRTKSFIATAELYLGEKLIGTASGTGMISSKQCT